MTEFLSLAAPALILAGKAMVAACGLVCAVAALSLARPPRLALVARSAAGRRADQAGALVYGALAGLFLLATGGGVMADAVFTIRVGDKKTVVETSRATNMQLIQAADAIVSMLVRDMTEQGVRPPPWLTSAHEELQLAAGSKAGVFASAPAEPLQ